jgi:ribosome-binding protein aMBF1 (putative translation factor)
MNCDICGAYRDEREITIVDGAAVCYICEHNYTEEELAEKIEQIKEENS